MSSYLTQKFLCGKHLTGDNFLFLIVEVLTRGNIHGYAKRRSNHTEHPHESEGDGTRQERSPLLRKEVRAFLCEV